MSSGVEYEELAIPTLKVMRLQSPDVEQPTAGCMDCRLLLGCSLALPDSFGVIHVGETFTAYLGAVNVSHNLMVRRLAVTAQLQTPSHRYVLASKLDKAMGFDINPGAAVDAIVSRSLEEAGQHILRVEVGYQTTEGGQKTLRKFYRFNVTAPITISEKAVRVGDNACIVSVTVENVSTQPMVIVDALFETRQGLKSLKIGGQGTFSSADDTKSAVQLFDTCGRLEPGSSFKYLFQVETLQGSSSKGIACGDQLGKVVFHWQKTMGESGMISSGVIQCPTMQPPGLGESNPAKVMMGTGTHYVVHRSGLSVDVATVAGNRAAGRQQASNLDQLLPVTVEPIDPPASMKLASPGEVQFLIVNHSAKAMNLQLQFRLNHMSGVAVCGKSFKNLGEIPGHGASTLVGVRLIALVAGLLRVQGCCVVDLHSGKEIPQPPLFNTFVSPSTTEQ